MQYIFKRFGKIKFRIKLCLFSFITIIPFLKLEGLLKMINDLAVTV